MNGPSQPKQFDGSITNLRVSRQILYVIWVLPLMVLIRLKMQVHRHTLVSAFVIALLESIISRLATSENLIYKLVSVAKKTGLSLALSETPKIGIGTTRPIWY